MSHGPKITQLPTQQRILLANQHLTLLPQRALFWEEKRYLLLADMHLGKAGHFRKHGSPIPAAVHWKDLVVLGTLIETYKPSKVIILGDLFHSALNNEWLDFAQWMQQYSPLPFVLVKGNHDMLPEEAYALEQLSVEPESWAIDPFLLTHQPLVEPTPQRGGWRFPKSNTAPEALYNLAGHIHPGAVLGIGLGQSAQMPCFFFGPNTGLLPAFGQFTGCVRMNITTNDQVYGVVSERSIIRVV
uniref:Ligase-associated DNA damage response endonuclease PdeM n=1 Tax=Roseihalotalea indica TaxID=2867963 RepID=A0AA49GKZ4_9BACT|nr:ligase-associated DNA damage response endonuclease PdeM [Tunicatimonas sp. TK19036]